MTLQLKLEKVPQQDLELFKKAIHSQSETLRFLIDSTRDRKYAIDLSICVELWYEINKKTVQQHPSEKCKVKLSLHKAYALSDALRNYSCNGISDYDRSRCNRYHMAVDQQLPTATQLAIQ